MLKQDHLSVQSISDTILRKFRFFLKDYLVQHCLKNHFENENSTQVNSNDSTQK